MQVVVICSKCGALCPSKWENGERVWLWEGQTCQNCGKESWVAHDPDRNWETGKLEQ